MTENTNKGSTKWLYFCMFAQLIVQINICTVVFIPCEALQVGFVSISRYWFRLWAVPVFSGQFTWIMSVRLAFVRLLTVWLSVWLGYSLEVINMPKSHDYINPVPGAVTLWMSMRDSRVTDHFHSVTCLYSKVSLSMYSTAPNTVLYTIQLITSYSTLYSSSQRTLHSTGSPNVL